MCVSTRLDMRACACVRACVRAYACVCAGMHSDQRRWVEGLPLQRRGQRIVDRLKKKNWLSGMGVWRCPRMVGPSAQCPVPMHMDSNHLDESLSSTHPSTCLPHVAAYVCTHVCTHVCPSVCTHVCTHICTQISKQDDRRLRVGGNDAKTRAADLRKKALGRSIVALEVFSDPLFFFSRRAHLYLFFFSSVIIECPYARSGTSSFVRIQNAEVEPRMSTHE